MGIFRNNDFEWDEFDDEESDFNAVRAFFGLVKFVVFIATVGYLIYRYRDEIKDKLYELTDRYEFLERLMNKLKSGVNDLERNSKAKFAELEDSLEDFQEEIERESNTIKRKVGRIVKDNKDAFRLNTRQEAIYNLIQDAGEVTMSEIADVIAGVTNRTLRRDTTKLEKLGLIVRRGRTKNSVYRLRK